MTADHTFVTVQAIGAPFIRMNFHQLAAVFTKVLHRRIAGTLHPQMGDPRFRTLRLQCLNGKLQQLTANARALQRWRNGVAFEIRHLLRGNWPKFGATPLIALPLAGSKGQAKTNDVLPTISHMTGINALGDPLLMVFRNQCGSEIAIAMHQIAQGNDIGKVRRQQLAKGNAQIVHNSCLEGLELVTYLAMMRQELQYPNLH